MFKASPCKKGFINMVELFLPKESKVLEGNYFKNEDNKGNIKKFKVYSWDPDFSRPIAMCN